MIDIHSHLLPGVDDGSRTLEQSVAVLTRFAQEGVREVVCTPHLKASRAKQAPIARFREKFAELQAAAPRELTLHLGWEIMLDEPAVDLSREGLSLGSSNAVLVEWSRHGLPPNHQDELFRIRMSGRVPVIAHVERYPGITPEIVAGWKHGGAVIQMDAAAPLMGYEKRDLALELLAHGLIDLFAADNHGDQRSRAPTRAWMLELGLEHQCELLTGANAGLVLRNEPPEPVPPMKVQRGWLQRLKERVLKSARGA
jgi:protein-tyrosine phosphatase